MPHAVLADREGITSELDLLVADFVMLEEELTALAQALGTSGGVDTREGGTAGWTALSNSAQGGLAATGGSAESGALPLGIIGEDVLEKLAVEIPDMRVRVGVM